MKRFARTAAALLGAALVPVGCSPNQGETNETPADDASETPLPEERQFAFRVLATGLQDPFEVMWGPDGSLWVTERMAGRVTRVSPVDGAKTTLLTIGEVVATPWARDGLMGMDLHPGLLRGSGEDFVYLAYTYDADSTIALERRAKIVRYTYHPSTQTLSSPVELLANMPGSDDHNSARLVFGPDQRLYYSVGDQGSNQFANYCNPVRSQELPTAAEVAASDWTRYAGKVLRLNVDGSIPADNPVIAGVRSHIYSYGHRNPQGLVFAPDGLLYSSEHGPNSDDEINIIEAGMNYGWPHVSGFLDDQAYVYGNWSAAADPPCSELEYSNLDIPPSVPKQKESDFSHPAFRPPVKTFYTVPSTHNFRDPACAADQLYFICWPSIAPSSIDFYGRFANGVPRMDNSLLLPSLKLGAVFRVPLGGGGHPLPRDAGVLFKTTNRYRDIAIHPDGRTFYVGTDSSGLVKGPAGTPTNALEHPGAILEFRAED